MAEPTHAFESYPDYTSGNSQNSTQYDTEHGYDIVASRLTKERRRVALNQANGVLSINAPGFQGKVVFFALEVSTTVGISGTWGQGRRIRDFYPKNLVGPSMKVTGQTLDQADYGQLAEFIHASQQQGITTATPITLYIAKGGLQNGNAAKGERASMKGPHEVIFADGFIQGIARKHERFVYAPKFQFEFVVSKSKAGLYKGTNLDSVQRRSLLDVLFHPEKKQGEPIKAYNTAEFEGKEPKKK